MRYEEFAKDPVRAYIVFSKNTTIEDGVKAIETEVFGGAKLDVTRFDCRGNAVVASVSGSFIKEIRNLPQVSRVKIEQPARPTGGASLL